MGIVLSRFFIDFLWILASFWRVLARFGGPFCRPKRFPKPITVRTLQRVRFFKDLGRVWEGSWEGLGTILGGFWQGLGAFWSILCNFTCFGPVRLRVGGFEPLGVFKTIIKPMLRLLEPFFRVFFSHRLSSWRLHASTVLIIVRSSRSLLRQVQKSVYFSTSFLNFCCDLGLQKWC